MLRAETTFPRIPPSHFCQRLLPRYAQVGCLSVYACLRGFLRFTAVCLSALAGKARVLFHLAVVYMPADFFF